MNCRIESTFPLTDKASKDATGRTLKEWYALLDSRGGVAVGRRQMVRDLWTDTGTGDWWATTLAVEYEKLRAGKRKDGLYEGYGICVTKTIPAPLDKLYEAWTDPKALSKWFGPATRAKVADGGSYESADGDRGKYLRVRPGRDLRFTWENPEFSAGSLVDVVFSEKGAGKSHVMLNHTRIQTRAEADGLRSGWGEAFDKLKPLLEK